MYIALAEENGNRTSHMIAQESIEHATRECLLSSSLVKLVMHQSGVLPLFVSIALTQARSMSTGS